MSDNRQHRTLKHRIYIPETGVLKDPWWSEVGGTALQHRHDDTMRVTSKKRPHHTGTKTPGVWHNVFHCHYKKLATFIIYDKPGVTEKTLIRKSGLYSSSENISDIIPKLVKKKYPMFDPAHNVASMETNSKTDTIFLLGFGVSYIYEVIGIGKN